MCLYMIMKQVLIKNQESMRVIAILSGFGSVEADQNRHAVNLGVLTSFPLHMYVFSI